jgi:hypothetical protein
MPDEFLSLNFYGIIVKVFSNDEECISFIRTDFSYFLISHEESVKEAEIIISVFLCNPPCDRIPKETVAAYHTKDAVVYKDGDVHYFDSSGKGMVIFDHKKKSAEIYSLQRDFLYEKSYLMIMSRVGEILDKKKLHRIHSMGVVYKGKAILCLLPMGGGKTTLALSLLTNKDFSLLSEEVPLVSNKGFLYPFPIRMGVKEGTQLSIPEKFLKNFIRSHYQPKILIDVEYFSEQISGKAKPGLLFIGRRIYSENPKIISISKAKTFPSLFRLCVMGIGIPQLMEYILRFDFLDMARQSRIIFSRLWAILLLLKGSKTYELHLGYNLTANADYLTEFITRNI